MRVTASYLEKLIRDYQNAYIAANGNPAPMVVWERGWFKIGHPSTPIRRAKLENMRDELRRRMRANSNAN